MSIFQMITGIENSILAHTGAFQALVTDSQNYTKTGYKSNRYVFEQLFSHEMTHLPRSSGNGRGVSSNSSTVAGSTTLVPLGINFQQGDIRFEGNKEPLSAAISGGSLFMVRDQNNKILYTRSSDWVVDGAGNLRDTFGRQVMGFSVNGGAVDRSSLVPIQVDPTNPEHVDIGFDDGGVLNTNFQSRNNEEGVVSNPLFQLGLAIFPNPSALQSAEGASFATTTLSGQPIAIGVSGEAGFGSVKGASKESSTVDPAELSIRGIQLQRSYNALQNSLSMVSKFLETMITTTGKAIG